VRDLSNERTAGFSVVRDLSNERTAGFSVVRDLSNESGPKGALFLLYGLFLATASYPPNVKTGRLAPAREEKSEMRELTSCG
jgi:hypothetical protein